MIWKGGLCSDNEGTEWGQVYVWNGIINYTCSKCLSVCVSVSICIFVSVSLCLCFLPSLSLCQCLSLCLYLSLTVCGRPCLCFCLFLCLCLCLCLCLTHHTPKWTALPISVSMALLCICSGETGRSIIEVKKFQFGLQREPHSCDFLQPSGKGKDVPQAQLGFSKCQVTFLLSMDLTK